MYLLLIGPRSDHCLALSLSQSLTALCQIGQTGRSLITFANDLSQFLHDFLEFIHLFHFILQKLDNNNVCLNSNMEFVTRVTSLVRVK